MITGINESKILTKHISCECKCKFDGRNCNSDQGRDNNKCWYGCKKRHVCEIDYVWNTATWNFENRKYLTVSVYCYLIKYGVKQKNSLPFHDTDNESRQVLYW